MARLASTSLTIDRPPLELGWDKHRRWWDDALASITTNLDPNAADLTGSLLRFQRADGYAFYLVTKHKPLTLQHVAIGDAWWVEPETIRGLLERDVRQQLQRAAAYKQLFLKR